MKTLQCRAHGGTFKIGPKRGRDPANCGGRWPDCTRVKTIEIQGRKLQVNRPDEVPQTNPSIGTAMLAQKRLQLMGWECKGHADVSSNWAALVCTRGEETLLMKWVDGYNTEQNYSLWYEKPSANGKPPNALSFDPDECTDRELVRALAGMKCTWWNVLGQKTEEAVIAPDSIKIEHAYNGHGDEQPGDRIVKFIEHGGAGFRAFRVAALLKVG